MSSKDTAPDKLDRETIHAKLIFLSSVIDLMGPDGREEINHQIDHYAVATMVGDIAREIYPECYEDRDGAA